MIPASPLPAQPAPDWRRQWRESITDPAELLRLLGLPGDLACTAAAARFRLRVTRAWLARIRPGDPHDPLLRQVLPLDAEGRVEPGYGADAVGDLAARVAPGLLRKYAGRALLVATGSCAIHCRYCFRREFPYAAETAARDRWQAAVAALAADPSINELILSGGDPWSLDTPRLVELTQALRDVPHLRRLRVHTRLPVVLPARVDGPLLDWLGRLPWPVTVVIHANHAREIDAAVATACADLRRAGATLLNQSVLLCGVNDDAAVLCDLSERLHEAGVLPYYLHQLDRVTGTAHHAVADRTARALHATMRARLPGYLVPRLVREIAGAAAKTPL